MIPWWKVKRETVRLREQSAAWLSNLYEPFLQKRHDRWRERQPQPADLGVALDRKVAIFLIYQPKGVAPSILVTLQWLVDNGYAPLVVANTPLSDQDRARVSPLAWRIFERPNFGYDFGGYRDGILLLSAWGLVPDRLLIINDSVWMPLRQDSTLIARLEAMDADLVGGIQHTDNKNSSGKVRRGHIESYLYLLNSRAVRSQGFQAFWKNYPVSSNRLNAVRRGERQFTHLMHVAELKVCGIFSKQVFLDGISDQDDDFLWRTLLYGSYVETYLRQERDDLVKQEVSAPGWRDAALRHIKRTADRRRFNACFAYPSDALLGMDFMKKSAGSTGDGGASLHSRLRQQLLQAVAAGDLPPLAPAVHAEIYEKDYDITGSRLKSEIAPASVGRT
ncbi:rhamnan synthesis F family protein [Tabrizicola sp.]|uniref:rhamnan synthesis F family protein n=1 Tax=Tabrizicola sp. TaxID=2005166 RepID=UPI002734B878|nr:rhamnan synthesis F family protein [Tabrizicola sp.]MDP3194848.1 rhamnan synthesis F family protein [Tabrizicola sp.]